MNKIHYHSKVLSFISTALICTVAPALSAATFVWENPGRETNTGSLYTASKITEADGASTRSTVLASKGFGAVVRWTDTGTDWLAGSTASNGLNGNEGIMNFADAQLPDIRLSLSGTPSSVSGSLVNNVSFSSNDATSLRLVSGSTSDPVSNTLTIDFGGWNGNSFNTEVNSVYAVGFTINSVGLDRWSDLGDFSVSFYDNAGGLLSVQTIPDGFPPHNNSASLFFGLISEEANIGYVEVSMTGTLNGLIGLDELGFSVIPEPSTTATVLPLTALAVVGLGTYMKRRKQNS